MKCYRLGCPNEAHVSPVISFGSKAVPDARVQFKLPLLVCPDHATPDVSQYISDTGWMQLVVAMKKAGRAYPSRDSLQVRYVPIL